MSSFGARVAIRCASSSAGATACSGTAAIAARTCAVAPSWPETLDWL